jgi:hypothetical protein
MDTGEGLTEVTVPLTVELLERAEETVQKCEDWGWVWFRMKKSEKTIIKAYEDFCRPYLPASLDLKKVQPNCCALFFSRVREESIDSMKKSTGSTASTGT